MNQSQVRVLLECEFRFYMVTIRGYDRVRLERYLATKGLSLPSEVTSAMSDNDLRRFNTALRTFLRT